MPSHREPSQKGVQIVISDKGVHSPEEQAMSMPKPPLASGPMPDEVKQKLAANMEMYRQRVQNGLAALGKKLDEVPQEKLDEIAAQARKDLELEGVDVQAVSQATASPPKEPVTSAPPAPASNGDIITEVFPCKSEQEALDLISKYVDEGCLSATLRVKYSVVVVRET